MARQIYMAAIAAEKVAPVGIGLLARSEISFTACLVVGVSDAEAMGEALAMARKEFPAEQGFRNHSANIRALDADKMIEAFEMLKKENQG